MTIDIAWSLLLPSLPSEPSRHRVATWRELRRIGAAPIGSGAWLIPAADPFTEGVARIDELVIRGGGTFAVLDAAPRDERSREALERAFAKVRLDEWAELVADCEKFFAEIDKEFAKQKFTLGELEEEEQSLDRLRRWLATLQERDVLGLPEAGTAAAAVRRAEERLGEYAERVLNEQAGPDALERSGVLAWRGTTPSGDSWRALGAPVRE